MNKFSTSVFAAVILSAASTAFAGEVPASLDAKNCKAEYPKASLINEEQGDVAMSFLVAADGSVVESKVDKSSGYKNLDRAAIKALSACKFKPGTKDGAVAQTWTKVDYSWKL
ncbi:energy transducer TonB [Duganella sp. BJB488]|uniref:energy transducer TonB n=1 Tax=unclassified Duganella TaxID=2636909 RepID=UPI000E34A3F3|nr:MULTISPECIES: energy transducer TonB [unclassified Duganella]NVD73307.1 energy transducer TonB [Duganella sp. BJB1802]RFP23136.1 energy transducer TonB [Duganella sp. BJB489]RFP24790.1 energy transducer TonB [Duganella sp. BJB488]RFP34134.1 energy transducer TonB [Duganella sp. BJB480]